jgi:hypothetical protein
MNLMMHPLKRKSVETDKMRHIAQGTAQCQASPVKQVMSGR